MTLRLIARAAPSQRIDLAALTPDRLAGLDRAAIEALPVATTRTPLALGELFRLRHGTPDMIVIEGGDARLDRIGAGMTRGSIVVDGDAGALLGAGMAGGRIEVRGDAGRYAATGATGGEIDIAGDAGEGLGAAPPGTTQGMDGGLVIVRGDAGPRAASRLRRGVIVIEGDAAEEAAWQMLAGTLIVCGRIDGAPGMLMRRGTLIAGDAVPLPSFVATGGPAPVFPRLLARALDPVAAAPDRLASRRAARLVRAVVRAYAGDMATLGKGELLLPAA